MILLLIIITFLNTHPALYDDQWGIFWKDLDNVPLQFANEQDALKANCKIVTIEGKSNRSCILIIHSGEPLMDIYDENAEGIFNEAAQICIPSAYSSLPVSFVDILGDEKKFIAVRSIANKGTGCLQIVLTIFGWHNNKYMPILIETLYNENGDLGEKEIFEMNYSFGESPSKEIMINLSYKYSIQAPIYYKEYKEFDYAFKAEWNDKLIWDNKKFTFYDENLEKAKEEFCLAQDIINARMQMRRKEIDLGESCDEKNNDFSSEH